MELSTHQRPLMPVSQASVSFSVSLDSLTSYICTGYYVQISTRTSKGIIILFMNALVSVSKLQHSHL